MYIYIHTYSPENEAQTRCCNVSLQAGTEVAAVPSRVDLIADKARNSWDTEPIKRWVDVKIMAIFWVP